MAGLPLDEPLVTPAQAKKPRGNKTAATTANDSTQGNGDDKTPAPVAEETQLAPEKLERINRAWNDYVAPLPAEEDKPREPGPRITML
jgi:hypothetical protein